MKRIGDASAPSTKLKCHQASLARLLNKGRAQVWRWANNKSGVAPHNEELIRKVLAENGLVVMEKKS